jgi:hypothetical protein
LLLAEWVLLDGVWADAMPVVPSDAMAMMPKATRSLLRFIDVLRLL